MGSTPAEQRPDAARYLDPRGGPPACQADPQPDRPGRQHVRTRCRIARRGATHERTGTEAFGPTMAAIPSLARLPRSAGGTTARSAPPTGQPAGEPCT